MKKLLLLLFLSLFIFSACKKDNNNEQEQITPTTFVKEETEIVAVNDNTITLTGNQTEIETSDIIVSGANTNAPNGFLRKVVSISSSNGNTVVQTQRATIGEAIKYYFDDGEEHQDNFSYTFSNDDIAGRSPSETNTTPISINIDETITADQDGVPIELNITGNLTITPIIDGKIKISRHNFEPVFDEFLLSITTENDFNLTLNSQTTIGFNTGDILLGRFETAPITLFVGIPIVIRPQFTLYIGSNGDLTANIIYTYNNNSTAIAGVTYDNGWQFLPNNGFTINSQSSTATASITGNLKAYVKPEFSLALYDNSVVSAGINIEPYARFEGTLNSTEYSWSVNGGIDNGAYFKAFDFGFTTLIDETWDNLIEIPEWEIASGMYNIATITNPIPTDNSTITTQPINFSWQPNDFTISPTYEILFGTDINSLTSIGTTNSTNFTYPNNTLNDDTYYWKIIAKDGNGDIITESLFFSFILDTSSTSVSPAHSPNPTDNSTDIAINGNLSFSEGVNTPNDATYKLYFDTSQNPTTAFTLGTGVTSYTYSNLQNGTTYYWKIETISNSGNVLATSPVWSFTTINNNSNSFPGQTVLVNGGTFTMGSPNGTGGSNEHPQHSVTLSSYKISKYEITNQQYADFMNAINANTDGSVDSVEYLEIASVYCQISHNGSSFIVDAGKANYPVVKVSWYGAKAYSEYYGGHLPTEAEWEFAARGGNSSSDYTYSGSNILDDISWNDNNSGGATHTVGTKNANEIGLYDMSGNVWEWTNDWYDGNYYSISPSNDPQGPSTGTTITLRGGGCVGNLDTCRVSARDAINPIYTQSIMGFRPVFIP